MARRGVLLCLVVCWSRLGAVRGGGGAPEGYLEARGERWAAGAGGEHPFVFYAGESVEFSCSAPRGDQALLRKYRTNAEGRAEVLAEAHGAGRARLGAVLRAEDAGAVLQCRVEDVAGGRLARAQLRLEAGGRAGGSTWVVVFVVVALVLLAAAGAWVWSTYRSRRKQNSSNMVTFADRNSIENLDPRAVEDGSNPGLKSNAPAPAPRGAPREGGDNSEPTGVLVEPGEPGEPAEPADEPTFASNLNSPPARPPTPSRGVCVASH